MRDENKDVTNRARQKEKGRGTTPSRSFTNWGRWRSTDTGENWTAMIWNRSRFLEIYVMRIS